MLGSAFARNHPTSTRGSPTDQISQSITAAMRGPAASMFPSRRSPCTSASGQRARLAATQRGRDLVPARREARVRRSRGDGTSGRSRPRAPRAARPPGRARRDRARAARPSCAPRVASARRRAPRRSSPSRSKSGSSEVPSTKDMTNSGGTSGGSPASSHRTSGTGTAVGGERAQAPAPGAARRGCGPAAPRRARPSRRPGARRGRRRCPSRSGSTLLRATAGGRPPRSVPGAHAAAGDRPRRPPLL